MMQLVASNVELHLFGKLLPLPQAVGAFWEKAIAWALYMAA